ncbi:MAG: hypothetical protein AAB599_03905 [Patescibacteria group bacterium]
MLRYNRLISQKGTVYIPLGDYYADPSDPGGKYKQSPTRKDRRRGTRPGKFEKDGTSYRWWTNISKGSFFLYVIGQFARYGTYKIQLRTPADHGPNHPEPTATSVRSKPRPLEVPRLLFTSSIKLDTSPHLTYICKRTRKAKTRA